MLKKTTKKKWNNNSKSKQRPIKLKTFNYSDFSLIDDNNNLGPICDLFKNEVLKKKTHLAQNPSQINFNSTVNNYTSVYTVVSSINPLKHEKVKSVKNIIKGAIPGAKKKASRKSKSKSKIVPDKKQGKKRGQKKYQIIQSYQFIPPSKNSLNSQIVFSTWDTKRQSEQSQRRKDESSRINESLNFVMNSQQNLSKNNKMLRNTIRQQFKRKNQAATKIQKVFRGYLTRKILQKYIKRQQQNLNYLLAEYKSPNCKQKDQANKRSRQFDFFSNNIAQSQRDHSSKTFRDEQSIDLQRMNPSIFNSNETESKATSERVHNHIFFNNRQGEVANCQDEVSSSVDNEQEDGSYSSQDNSLKDQGFQQQSQTSSEQIIAYHHQEPIYNGSQIQQFLQSSSEDQQIDFSVIQKYKVKKMFNHDQIIFETNEEHIQSRKNSILYKQTQPKDKYCLRTNSQEIKITCQVQIKEIKEIEEMCESDDPDLIITSNVDSIHNVSLSHKNSFMSEKQQIQLPNTNQVEKIIFQSRKSPSQRTSKKQCKEIIPKKRQLNIKISSQQSQTQQIKESQKNYIGNKEMHLHTINFTGQQQNLKQNGDKKVGMDTISCDYEFEFKLKAKRQIGNNLSSQKISQKKKDLIKKRIYYFSDSSDHAEYQSQTKNEKILKTPKDQGQISINNKQIPVSNQVEMLKNIQIKRWNEVINLIDSRQIENSNKDKGNNIQFQHFIKQVMQLSLKNKQILKDMITQNKETINQSSAFKHLRIDSLLGQNDLKQESQKQLKLKQFKYVLSSNRRKSITQQEISVFKPGFRAIIPSKGCQKQLKLQEQQTLGPSFFREPKQQLKQKINKIEIQNFKRFQDSRVKQFSLLNNLQNDHIEQMLKVREQMLQKRQCQQLTKLNQKLKRKELTQKNFLHDLKKLTSNFQTQKASIDKARDDISEGYNAAIKLIKETLYHAKRNSYRLPFSKSSENYKLNKHLGFGVLTGLNNVIIDQLTVKSPLFLMERVQIMKNLKQGPKGREMQKTKGFKQQCKQLSVQKPVQNKDKQTIPKANETAQFIKRSSSIQSSPSIINNLSQKSFKEQFFQSNYFPKPQATYKKPQTHLKNNVLDFKQCGFDDMSQQSSEVGFSQEQLRRFRKAQPFDSSIADMNRNVMIGKDFIQMQKGYEYRHSFPYDCSQKQKSLLNQESKGFKLHLYRQVYQIQDNESQRIGIPLYLNQVKRYDPKVDLITQKHIEFLIFQISCQLLMKPLFSQKLLLQKRQQMFGIKRVSDQCRRQFLEIVEKMLPSHQSLTPKINQNISPLPQQLLKCMRIDFNDQDQAENQEQQQQYEQIGKYQMILDQDLCNYAIEKYHQQLQRQNQEQNQLLVLTSETVDNLRSQYQLFGNAGWQERAFKYLGQRQKFVRNRREHCEGIRWQFVNMELHCLFDTWNQLIIELKAGRNRFPGSSLNQLTLSLVDRNKKVEQSQVQDILLLSKFKIMKILNYQEYIIDQINRKIMRNHKIQNQDSRISTKSLKQELQESRNKYSWVYLPNKQIQEELDLDQQSKWVCYSDQALSYGLELVYLIQEQILGQTTNQMRRIMLQLQLD